MSDQQHAKNKAKDPMRIALIERAKVLDKLERQARHEFHIWDDTVEQAESMRQLLSETIAMRDAATGDAKNLWKKAVAAVEAVYEDALNTRNEAAQALAAAVPDTWQRLRVLEEACRQIHRASHPNEHSQEEE